MSVILALLAGFVAVAGWWLVRQGILSKPWLETGADPVAGSASTQPTGRVGLGVLMAVIAFLFALFGSAFVMRMDLAEWTSLTLPAIVWANTAQLVLASLFLQAAVSAERRSDRAAFRRDLAVAVLATAGFLVGQLIAWRELAAAGEGLTAGPGASFFYLLSGLHGLHVLGGLAALGAVASGRREATGLCAAYWHFLLIVWLGLLTLFLGWANQLVDICRAVLT